MNKKIASLMLGLGLGLGALTVQAGPDGQCNGQSDESCIQQERLCMNSGASYTFCDRQLSRCLYNALNCQR
ncbi:hypothetical protein [Colwellia sp. RSH04]|uniref:hypothetical protein n=1 Tax=Colwellia sp. RSH04 TaxID=2305464 RepID=UPI000E5777DD|nr:hypothetical protein [Colwellia sp. RSH04]RHW76244.1 hypothetical protein D1094_07920 [Colwellia sp. RSH04]